MYSSIRGIIIIIIIIIIKKDRQCKAGRVRLTPYQSEDPSPTLPTYRGKEEKGKVVEDQCFNMNNNMYFFDTICLAIQRVCIANQTNHV